MQNSSIIGPMPKVSHYECGDCGERFPSVDMIGGDCTPFPLHMPRPVECPGCGSQNVRKLGLFDVMSDIKKLFGVP